MKNRFMHLARLVSKPLLLAFGGALVLAATTIAAEVKLASVVWPPFSGASGESRVAIALVHEALYRAGYGADTTLVEDGTLTPALRDGRFDGSPAMWRSEEREAFLFYSRSILENRLVLVGRKGAEVDVLSLSDLPSVKVAIVEGYDYGQAVSGVTGPTFVTGRDHQQNLERLLGDEVDYMLVDELLIHYVLERQAKEASQYLEVGTAAMVKRTLHFAVRKDVEGAELMVRRFDAEIQKMLADGTYNRLLGVNWIRADADGDGKLELILVGESAGTEAPARGYQISSAGGSDTGSGVGTGERYWIDGAVFQGWGEVPERYKAYDPTWPDAANRQGTVFRFNF